MARKPEIGITYYPVNVDHISHNKIKLLMSEFGTDGYWIYVCLLSEVYKAKGYYMDVSNQDHITLFATDVCKKQVSLVNEVIKGCVRRGLFDKSVFDSFAVLTSDRIQENFLEATQRRKDARDIYDKYLLIDYINNKNVNIIELNVDINPQSKVKVNKIKLKESKPSADEHAPDPELFKSEELKNEWLRWERFKKNQFRFTYKSDDSKFSAKKELLKHSGLNEKIAVEIIRESIVNGWKGLFPLKQNQIINDGKIKRNNTGEVPVATGAGFGKL